MPDVLEAICIVVKKPRMKPLLVCSWYRAPDLRAEIFDHFEIFLQNIEHENKDVILTGDLNCNLLNTETNGITEKFQDLMRNYQLKQHKTTPTRITNDTQSLIDIIITKVNILKPSTQGSYTSALGIIALCRNG